MTAGKSMSDAEQGADPARPEPQATAASSADLSLLSLIGRLQDLDGSALRGEWRRLSRSEPPRTSRDLLARAVA